jgi:hypothetical protein
LYFETSIIQTAGSCSSREQCGPLKQLTLELARKPEPHADHTTLVVSDGAAAYIQAIGGTVSGGVFERRPLDVTRYLDGEDQRRSQVGGKLRIRADWATRSIR